MVKNMLHNKFIKIFIFLKRRFKNSTHSIACYTNNLKHLSFIFACKTYLKKPSV